MSQPTGNQINIKKEMSLERNKEKKKVITSCFRPPHVFRTKRKKEKKKKIKERNKGGVWFVFSNNNFYFLDNIIHIFILFLPTCIFTNVFK